MWKNNEIKKLVSLYPNKSNLDIAKILGRTKSSIDNKAYRLGLKKSDEFLKMRNKMGHKTKVKNGGRDLNFKNLKEIASRYKTKIEFIKNDEPAYQAALNKGVLDDICEHMSVIKFSIPQLILENIMDKLLNSKCRYNDRKIIKPYELDLYYHKFKLAFEYQGSYWHGGTNTLNDDIKVHLCEDKGITLIHIYEISRDYEKDIKKQIISNLDIINKVTDNNFTNEDVKSIIVGDIHGRLYNKKELIKLAKSYDSFKKFKNDNVKEYKKMLKLNIIDEATAHMRDKRKVIKLTTKEIKVIVGKYDNLTDFRKNELQLYKHLKKTNKSYLISHLNRKLKFTLTDIKKTVSKYDRKCDFINDNYSMYRFIKRTKLNYIMNSLSKC